MTGTIIGSIAAAALIACGLGEWLERRRQARLKAAAFEAWNVADLSARDQRLSDLTETDPTNSLAWYLRGCSAFRSRDFTAAARYFGMAHHHDPNLISAALLTFTALKSASPDGRSEDRWVRELVETWQEMKLSKSVLDRLDDATTLLNAELCAAPEELSSLGRWAWLLDAPQSAAVVRELIDQRPAWAAPLFQD